jgi:hypothetical protein
MKLELKSGSRHSGLLSLDQADRTSCRGNLTQSSVTVHVLYGHTVYCIRTRTYVNDLKLFYRIQNEKLEVAAVEERIDNSGKKAANIHTCILHYYFELSLSEF